MKPNVSSVVTHCSRRDGSLTRVAPVEASSSSVTRCGHSRVRECRSVVGHVSRPRRWDRSYERGDVPGKPGPHSDRKPLFVEFAPCQRQPDLFYAKDKDLVQRAKEICHTCPAMIKCRTHAMRQREPYGVWGGMSERDRHRVWRRLRRRVA